jgi:hypothetical protein
MKNEDYPVLGEENEFVVIQEQKPSNAPKKVVNQPLLEGFLEVRSILKYLWVTKSFFGNY